MTSSVLACVFATTCAINPPLSGLQAQGQRKLPPLSSDWEATNAAFRRGDAAAKAYDAKEADLLKRFDIASPLTEDGARALIAELYFDFGHPGINRSWQTRILGHFARYPVLAGFQDSARKMLQEALLDYWAAGGVREGYGDPRSAYSLALAMCWLGEDDPVYREFGIEVQRYGKAWARRLGDDRYQYMLDMEDGFGEFSARSSRYWRAYVTERFERYDLTDEQIASAESIYQEIMVRHAVILRSRRQPIEKLRALAEEADLRADFEEMLRLAGERRALQEPTELRDELVRRLDALITLGQRAAAMRQRESRAEALLELIKSARRRHAGGGRVPRRPSNHPEITARVAPRSLGTDKPLLHAPDG